MKILFLILFSTVTFSCDKNDDLIAPPITQENTFSCMIDGELFVAQPNIGFPISNDGFIVITTKKKWLIRLTNAKGYHLYFNLIKKDSLNQVKISESDGDEDFFYDEVNAIEYAIGINKFISHNNTGFINILEWANDKKLIFEFEKVILYNIDDPLKTILLTDGKLNLNLETINEE